MIRIGIVVMLALIFSFSRPVRGDNWPAFRGPTGDGHAAPGDVPLSWSASSNIAWKRAIPGQGWSSPVVYEGRVYLTAAVPLGQSDDYSLRLYKLDADSGDILAAVDVFQQNGATTPKIHGKNSFASPTPLIDGGQIFVHFGHEGTACLDLQGKVVWRNNELRYPPVHGNGGSPILVGDALIFSCDGRDDPFVVALDRRSGQQLWKTPRTTDASKKFSFSTPTLVTVGGGSQVISPGSDAVFAYDPASGEEIWRVGYDGYSVVPKPVFGNGLVFVCTGFNRPSLLAIRPDGRGDVTATHVAWKTDRAVPHTASPLLVDDRLYMISDRGVASCLDARSGEVHWQERVGGNFSASPIYAAGNIFLLDEEGNATVIKAGSEFQRVASNSVGEQTLASCAVADGALFLRGEEHLYRIEAR